jgi:hypothetical protein
MREHNDINKPLRISITLSYLVALLNNIHEVKGIKLEITLLRQESKF